jgi:ubiquinone/menaquinone biosynthesis C-methylase UbiE
MDLHYEIIKVLFKGRSYFAPLDDPRRILDVGTGTGKWAIEMGRCASLELACMANSGRQSLPTG